MWIRSQDRKRLVNTNHVNIRELDILRTNVIDAYFGQSMYLIGEYSTKEKAMKVMDMIHDQIMLGSLKYEDVKSNDNNQQWLKSEFVFQMPKDEEMK